MQTYDKLIRKDLENLENDQGKFVLAQTRDKLKQVKDREKEQRDIDIKRVKGNYAKIPYGSDVVTK